MSAHCFPREFLLCRTEKSSETAFTPQHNITPLKPRVNLIYVDRYLFKAGVTPLTYINVFNTTPQIYFFLAVLPPEIIYLLFIWNFLLLLFLH